MNKFLLSSIALAVLGSNTATAQEGQATEGEGQVLEEVVVHGIRASLEKSLNQKRFDDAIVDSISSEELGKFPDTNVAESLQRVTGVAITRSRGGAGQFVTVRGLGEEFNAVRYNGRLLATENSGREFSFDVIASERPAIE